MDTEQLWHIMTTLQRHYGGFTAEIVVALAGPQHRGLAKRYFSFLAREGVIREGDAGFSIERSGFAPPARRAASPVVDACEQAMWTALRAGTTLAAAELAMMASTEKHVVSEIMARSYLAALGRAGYVRRIDATRLCRLVPRMNSGPRAPVLENGAAFDLNLMRPVNVTAQPAVNHGGRAA